MNKPWKVVVAFAGVFVAGAVAGGPLLALIHKIQHDRRPPFAERTMERYERELGISAAQRERIQPILLRVQDDWRQLRQRHVEELMEVVDRMHTEVSAELTPDQRPKLEAIRMELKTKVERYRGRTHDRERREDRRAAH